MWLWGGECGEVGVGRWVWGGGCRQVGVGRWVWGGECGEVCVVIGRCSVLSSELVIYMIAHA